MQYQTSQNYSPIITASAETRVTFLYKVYQHLALAIGFFIAFEAILFALGVPDLILDFLTRNSSFAWLAILGAFMLVSTISSKAAYNFSNPTAQYAGLFGISAAYALMFAPLLASVFNAENGSGTVMSAAIITLVGFSGLSLVAYSTRKDLSFLRPIVTWGVLVAVGAIFASVIFSFQLGQIFSVVMVALMGASILYNTQKIYKEYPEQAYVGAAVNLFASLMTMFWYVLRIFSDR